MRGPPTSPKTRVACAPGNAINAPENDFNGHVTCSRSSSNTSCRKEEDHGGTPLWKVGRMLMDSLNKGKMRRTKIFGAPLEDLPLNCQGMPKIVHRLCSHLEQFGLKEPELFSSNKKQAKIVDKLKISFDRAGDADLENCADVRVVASLLKLWLHDLPHPLIPNRISVRLRTLIEKYERKEVYDLDAEFCNALITCPALNLGVLYTVMRLLCEYVAKWYPAAYIDQLLDMFAKILIGGTDVRNVEIMSSLVHNFHEIFNERILERAFKLYIIRDKRSRMENRKCSRLECSTLPSSVDKLPRSNSEEKLSLLNDRNHNMQIQNLNIRRVSSHEDFSGYSDHNLCRSLQVANAEQEHKSKVNDRHSVKYRFEQFEEPVVDNFKRTVYACDKEAEVMLAPPPLHYNGDSRIQEEIRNEERFNPQFNICRNTGRRKRNYQGYNVKPKMQPVLRENTQFIVPKQNEIVIEDEISDNYDLDGIIYTSPDMWNWLKDLDTHSNSSTSSSSSSESNSVSYDDVAEPIQYRCEYSEPVSSVPMRHPYDQLSTEYYQENRGSPATHLSNVDTKIVHVNKHLQWVKKKMKRFERDFEDRFGETPTIMNKMSHPEYKHMAATIIFLKNNLKQLRKEANESFSAHRLLYNRSPNDTCVLSRCSSFSDKEEAFQEAEKHLLEKRLEMERPECVEQMLHEQLQDEKVSIQKELLNLENTFGQTTARNEQLFRPIYERYRTVKRFLARSTISLKFKETVSSELETIDENKTMDFDTSPVSISSEYRVIPSACQPVCNASRNDFQISNIHELSSPELMMEYKSTKEEKKKLRNRIYMYEQEVENRTVNDSKHCIHSLRCRYKNTKAKLKLLEALLMKTK